MNLRPLRAMTAAAIAAAFSGLAIDANQIRRQVPAQVQSQQTVESSLKAGGDAYSAKGQGSCTHAPKASIYGIGSEMWSVTQDGQGHSLQLTLWKPFDGSAVMFSLSLNGKKTISISTVRGAQATGSGAVTLLPSGKGGTFTVDAKTRTGDAVTGTITCDAFAPAIAEGGD